MFNKLIEKLFPPSPYVWNDECQGIVESDATALVIWSLQSIQFADLKHIFEGFLIEQQLKCKLWIKDETIKNLTLNDRCFDGVGKIIALAVIPDAASQQLANLKASCATQQFTVAEFAVKNSVPLANDFIGKNFEQTPGLVSVSFFKRKSGMDLESFKQYWFGSHTPFALEVHPLWAYERNRVITCIDEGLPGFDAIVPLHLKQDESLGFLNFFLQMKRIHS